MLSRDELRYLVRQFLRGCVTACALATFYLGYLQSSLTIPFALGAVIGLGWWIDDYLKPNRRL